MSDNAPATFCTIFRFFYLFSFFTSACFSMCLQNIFSKCFYKRACPLYHHAKTALAWCLSPSKRTPAYFIGSPSFTVPLSTFSLGSQLH